STSGGTELPPPPAPESVWDVQAKTGNGNDTARVQLGGVREICIQLTVDMGNGNDSYLGDILNRPLPLPLRALIDLGNGHNQCRMSIGGVGGTNPNEAWTIDV